MLKNSAVFFPSVSKCIATLQIVLINPNPLIYRDFSVRLPERLWGVWYIDLIKPNHVYAFGVILIDKYYVDSIKDELS